MWENVIGFHVRRCNRNLLLVNAGILAAILVWAHLSERYLYNCFAGPFPATQETLAKIVDPMAVRRYFVSLDRLQPLQTGLQYIETDSRKVTATYFAVPADSRLLLIKSPDSTASSRYQGGLVAVPNDVQAYFQGTLLDPKHLQFDGAFLPYILDANSFRSDAYWALLFVLPLGGLAAFNLYKAIVRFRVLESSPIVRSLRRFNQPLSAIAMTIDQDLKANPDISCIKSVNLTARRGAIRWNRTGVPQR
jgi:hypothetical protein